MSHYLLIINKVIYIAQKYVLYESQKILIKIKKQASENNG